MDLRVQRFAPESAPATYPKCNRVEADTGELQNAVAERIKGSEEVKSNLATLWANAEKDVAERWETDLLALAPGEEVLDGV
jgi:hypothetical protein